MTSSEWKPAPGSTILVTGAAGFIGARVSELLLQSGHRVVGIDNLNDAYDVRLKHWRLDHLMSRDGFTFHELDICDRTGALETAISGAGDVYAVINLAARAGVRQSVEAPHVYADTNLGGTLNLLEACRTFAIPKFVLASSSSLYGMKNRMPYSEAANTDRPVSPYAASKKAAEVMCHAYHELHGLDVTVFRYFTVYGPAGRPDMSPLRFVQWIAEGRPVTVFGDGTQSRDFTYVDDIARGTMAGLRPLGYEIINLGSDTPIVLMDALNVMEEAVGRKANIVFMPRHDADITATWADITRARTLLGWEPRTSLKDGVAALAAWYMENRNWASEIETGA